MAGVLVAPYGSAAVRGRTIAARRAYGMLAADGGSLAAGGFGLFTFVVHGYHPYVEDGGLYLAGVKHLVDPALYPHNLALVAEHPRFSIFAHVVAALVRMTHLSVEVIALALYGMGVWLTLLAVWGIARRCFATRGSWMCAVAAVAAGWTMPIAGTSVLLMDPYLTARSLATPLGLFAIMAGLDWMGASVTPRQRDGVRTRPWRAGAICVASLLGACLMHPLLGVNAAGMLAAFAVSGARRRRGRGWGLAAFCGAALAAGAAVQWVAPRESIASVLAIGTRGYWFLANWRWYEMLGLEIPVAVLLLFSASTRRGPWARRRLAAAGLTIGLASVLVAMAFAHPHQATLMVARLQPLRAFQYVYFVTLVMLGGAIGEAWGKLRAPDGVLVMAGGLLVLGGMMMFFERQTYASSERFELPAEWMTGRREGPWVRAFLWVKGNTPKDALFAADPRYLEREGEDAHGFRAMAERSILADVTKDGGDAATKPALAEAWAAGTLLQEPVAGGLDEKAEEALRRNGVTWLLLDATTKVSFGCVYRNAAVKVCRLP